MVNRYKFLFFTWTSFVLTLIAWPMREYDGTVETLYDKVIHLFLFGIFTYLFLAWRMAVNKKNFNYVFSIILGVGYSASAEYLQNFVPGRDVSDKDLLAGVIGVVLGVIVYFILSFLAKRK